MCSTASREENPANANSIRIGHIPHSGVTRRPHAASIGEGWPTARTIQAVSISQVKLISLVLRTKHNNNLYLSLDKLGRCRPPPKNRVPHGVAHMDAATWLVRDKPPTRNSRRLRHTCGMKQKSSHENPGRKRRHPGARSIRRERSQRYSPYQEARSPCSLVRPTSNGQVTPLSFAQPPQPTISADAIIGISNTRGPKIFAVFPAFATSPREVAPAID